MTKVVKACEDVKTAKVTLEKTPDDPDANTVVGKHLCFVKGDWDKGLPMLALGNDAVLKALTRQELQGAASSTEQIGLGDGWWELAEKEPETSQKQTRTRAAYWYRKALPGLSGLAKDRIQKLLDSLEERQATPAVVENKQAVPAETSLPEHTSWTIPYTWSEQVQRWKSVSEYAPGSGYSESRVPYMATVRHFGTKVIHARLVNYDYKTGTVVLKSVPAEEVAKLGSRNFSLRRTRQRRQKIPDRCQGATHEAIAGYASGG